MTDPLTAADDPAVGPPKPLWRRLLPLGMVVLALVLFFLLDLDRFFSLEALKVHRADLVDFVDQNVFLAFGLFVMAYAAAVAISFPGASFLTILGGFLFGTLIGGVAVAIGATAGAVAIFLVAQTSLGEPLRARAGPWLARLQEGFARNAFNYLLAIRLIPAFPFWVVNLVPAFLGMRTGPYALATFIGILPGVFVYASLGNGVGAAIDAGDDIDLSIIWNPAVFGPMLGLAALALLPMGVRALRRGKDTEQAEDMAGD